MRLETAAKPLAGSALLVVLSCAASLGCSSDESNSHGRPVDSGVGGAPASDGSANGGTSGSGNGGASASDGASSGGNVSSGGASGTGGANGGADGAVSSGGASGAGGVSNGGAGGAGGASGGGAGGASTGGADGAPPANLDMYVLFDKTGSMGCTVGTTDRWTTAVWGFRDFLSSANATGVGVGLTTWSFGSSMGSCDTADFSTPEVEIAPLPGNLSTLSAALFAATPNGPGDQGPAIQAGVEHARTWAQAHPNRTVILVFVADGMNSTNCANVDPVPLAAQGLSGTPSIPTYVVGLFQSATPCAGEVRTAAEFDPLAQAGGTTAAVMADLSAGPKAVQDAFDQIRARGGS